MVLRERLKSGRSQTNSEGRLSTEKFLLGLKHLTTTTCTYVEKSLLFQIARLVQPLPSSNDVLD